jgi:hypothetical protein
MVWDSGLHVVGVGLLFVLIIIPLPLGTVHAAPELIPRNEFPLSGIEEPSTIRSLLEVCTWYPGVTAHSTTELSSTLSNLISKHLKIQEQPISGTAPSTPADSRAPERFLLKMPQNLHSYEKQICVSEGFGDQVKLCQPIEEGDEYELVNSMIDELNSKCGLDLSHEFSPL